MSDEELVKRLRDEHLAMTRNEAADRIEALSKERDKVWDEAVWAVAQVVDQEMARIGFIAGPDGFGRRAEMRNVISEELKSVQSMRATLAEIEGEKG
jgi:Cdc6-like AAA superfamily ATPase